ncbi:MAG: LuxR C-terminal-related transcriptional regulator [Phycisphaerales bacterium]
MTGALLPGQMDKKPGISLGAPWDALAHDCGCAVLLIDAQLRIVNANAHAGALYGLAAGPLVGRSYLDVLNENGLAHRKTLLERVLASGRPHVVRYVLHRQARVLTCRVVRHVDLPGGRGLLITCRDDAAGEHVDPSAELSDERDRASNPLSDLTARERQVLQCIGEGLSSIEIARKLHRSVKTVEGHRARLGYKLGARNRAELTRLAIALGLVQVSRSPVKPAPQSAE